MVMSGFILVEAIGKPIESYGSRYWSTFYPVFSPVVIWLYKRYCFNHLSIGQLQFRLGIQLSKFMSAAYVPLCLCLVIGIAWSAAIVYWVDLIGTNLFTLGIVLSYLFCLALVWPMISARLYIPEIM